VRATLGLIEESGLDQVTVRDAAERVGVSSGAPFRHFEDRAALMAAVAEEVQGRCRAEIDAELRRIRGDDPVERFRAMGVAYLRWALRNPTHFEITVTPRLYEFEETVALTRIRQEIAAQARGFLEEAQRRGMLRNIDLRVAFYAGRALVYGLARLAIDGHLSRWGVAKISLEVLDSFMAGYLHWKPGRRRKRQRK